MSCPILCVESGSVGQDIVDARTPPANLVSTGSSCTSSSAVQGRNWTWLGGLGEDSRDGAIWIVLVMAAVGEV